MGQMITFAVVKRISKRHISSWLLLAVYLPMLLLSSVHTHSFEHADEFVGDCVHDHCSGHFGDRTVQFHECLLCQFLTTLVLTSDVVDTIIPFSHVCIINRLGSLQGNIAVCCGSIDTRAPPAA